VDKNKLAKLNEVGYKIRGTCANCKYSTLRFENRTFKLWGTCLKHLYKHEKHTDTDREMSVNHSGNCGDHEWDSFATSQLGDSWQQFREK